MKSDTGTSQFIFLPQQYDLRNEVQERVHEDPPYGLVYRKGEKNVALTRGFAEFCIHSKVAIALVNWLHSVYWGDELFYSTLATVTSVDDKVDEDEP